MNENMITVIEAEKNGVSMEMVRVCKEIRKLAKLDRIKLDETVHRSGLNKHLYSFIEYCGIDVKDYIKVIGKKVADFALVTYVEHLLEDDYLKLKRVKQGVFDEILFNE